MKNSYLFRKAALCLIGVFFLSSAGYAQRQLTGMVRDTKGESVPFASVYVPGSTTGATTDLDGRFILNVAANVTHFEVSFMGFITKKVEIGSKTQFDIVLESSSIGLDEVVVIGYATTKKRDLTGSVSSVDERALKDAPVSSAAEALSGRLPGVQVTTTEGSPDAEIKVRVRGGGSITQDNSPLYIVDGFPVNSISDLAPSEIASIDVLKDASSTAIYGARGANGVIIVTTKGGQEGRITASYNFFGSVKNMAKKLDVLSPYEYAFWQYELQTLKGKYDDKYVPYFGDFQDIDLYRGVDGNNWQDVIFGQSGRTFNHSVNISGGNDFGKFNFTYNRIDDNAIMMLSNYKRDNLNFKTQIKPLKVLTLDVLARYSNTRVRGSGANEQNEKSSADSRLKHAMIYTPIPLKKMDAESDEEESLGNLYPPTTAVRDNDQKRERESFALGGAITWEIIKGLKLRSEISYDQSSDVNNRFYGLSTYYVTDQAAVKNHPINIYTDAYKASIRNTNVLSWDFSRFLPKSHNFDAMFGQEMILTNQSKLEAEAQGFPDFFDAEKAWSFMSYTPLLPDGAISGSKINNVFSPDDRLLSFFGRVNYNFKGKYLFSATMRADGSSKFSAGNQWGYFPSAAVAWRISDEPFMKGASKVLDNLKLRFSVGTAGNNNIPGGQTRKEFSSSSTDYISIATSIWKPGIYLDNPDLRWETMVTRNIGLDFNLFNYRLGGSVEAYLNTTKDLLILFPISGSGYTYQYQNMGQTSNKGIEIALNGIIVDKKNFTLEAAFNMGFNKNRITSLGDLGEITASTNWASSEITYDYKAVVGQAIGQMYGYKVIGRYDASEFSWNGSKWVANEGTVNNAGVIGTNAFMPGAIKFEDRDNNGVIDDADKDFIGDANPKFSGGFNVNARFYGFDLGVYFNFVYGNKIYNANFIEYTSSSKYDYRNMLADMAYGSRFTHIDAAGNRITDPAALTQLNQNSTLWSPYMEKFVFHDAAVEDGSFLRLSNLTLGYSLPKAWLSKIYVQNLRIYCTLSNLWLLTNYSGFDPEVDTRRKTPLTPGVDYSAYPKSKGYTFGLNLTF